VADFAQRSVMDGGGRGGSGEEERRSAGTVPGALREGAVTRKGSRRSSTATITDVVRCQPSTTRDQAVWWMPGAAAVDRLPRKRLVFAG
jgi:hypothetical protein